jgi:predicted DNA-binding antitoxin AbrB/MazE fold protein
VEQSCYNERCIDLPEGPLMTITTRAVYEGGVLRPAQPLPLNEGETVEVTVARSKPTGSALRPPTPEEEDYARRIKAARSLDEMLAIMTTAPPLPEGYDLCRALNENRKATGERLLFPELEDERNP